MPCVISALYYSKLFLYLFQAYYAEDKNMVYATWIQDSMAGLGTRDSDLIRLILARAEVGLVSNLFLV